MVNDMPNSKISVSVVLYRDYESPLRMIESLYSQTDDSIYVSVCAVDNSEAESTGLERERDEFIERASVLGNFSYVDSGGNLGFGHANNIALSAADSEYHAFVNPDITFVGDAFSPLISFMNEHPEAGMAIPRMVDENGALQRVYRQQVTALDAINRTLLGNRLKRRGQWHTMANEDYSKPFRVPFGQGSFLFGRTALLKELGGFDERFFMYLEDADLCRRVNEVSELWYCPEAIVEHRWERGSHKSIRLLRFHLASYAAYFRKWGFRFA